MLFASTWRHHRGGHAGCCVSHGSCGFGRLHRCHQSERCTQFGDVSSLSTPRCLPGRAAAPPSYSNTNKHRHSPILEQTHTYQFIWVDLMQTCDRLTMLLSSLRASSTMSLLGLCFCFKIAVEKSSPFGLFDKRHIMTLLHAGPALVSLISSCDAELYLDSLWLCT